MTDFTVSTEPFAPCRMFPFRLKWDGRYVAGFSKASMLHLGPQAENYRGGDAPSPERRTLEQNKGAAITLENGVCHDTEFVAWANTQPSLTNARKEFILEIYDEVGELRLACTIQRCWVSEFLNMPDPGAPANAVAIERIKIENEGFAYDDL